MTAALRLLSAVVDSTTPSEPPSIQSSQSDFVIILAALSCALMCALALALVVRCGCIRCCFSSTSTTTTSNLSPPGLKKKNLQSLPTATYISGVVGGETTKSTDCAICLAEFCDGDVMRVLPQCGHVFHVSCIDGWLGCHSSCPSCRQLVVVVTHCDRCCASSAIQGTDAADQVDERLNRTKMRHQHDTIGFLP